jgi:hypothetical protein
VFGRARRWKPFDARTYLVKGHRFGSTGSDAERRALIAFLKTLSVRPSATRDGARRQYQLPQSSVTDKYPTRRCAASERPDAPPQCL